MADLTLYAVVTRTELSLSDLDLNDDTEFRVVSREIDPGQVSWSKQEAGSPFVHGAVIAHATKELATAQLNLHVIGTTMADLADGLDRVQDAFSQEDYDLTLGFDGHYYTYDCGPADWQSGFVTEFMLQKIIPLRLSIPVQPTYTTSSSP